ncbi:MAG: NAD(P)-dependent oxidoreductase [Bacteroidales bacterium]|nr:NAD(P)-dependent oxidoreductase [Bacteroidales bacterium]
MRKKIIITGAGGFIGSYLVEEALKQGFEVYAGVRASTNLEYLQDERINFITLNFADKEQLTKEIEEFAQINGKWDYIVHNMGITKTLDHFMFDKINFSYLKTFVDALIATSNVPERFVYMSSLSAWRSDTKELYHIDDKDHPYPSSAYGRSKFRGELYLRSLKNFPFIAMRPTGVYGPREKDYFEMIKLIKNGLDITVGFEQQYLTFIYVKDLVKAVFLALEKGRDGEGYFLTDGVEYYTQKDFRKLVSKALGKKFVLPLTVPLGLVKMVCNISEKFASSKSVPVLNKDKFQILKQRNWTCDTSKAENDLGYVADYNLEKGINECIEWYKENGWL